MKPHEQLIERLWDQYGSATPDGLEYDALAESVAGELVDVLALHERDLHSEARALVDSVMRGVRRTRRRGMRGQLDYVMDSLFVSGDEGANIDPLLSVCYPVGTTKGLDKALRFWTLDDFRVLVATAYRNAADVTAAARELDESVERVVGAMTAARVERLGGLAESAEQ